MSFDNMNTPRRRKAVASVGDVLAELLAPEPDPVAVNVSGAEFRRLMQEHGIKCGSGIVLPRAVVTTDEAFQGRMDGPHQETGE